MVLKNLSMAGKSLPNVNDDMKVKPETGISLKIRREMHVKQKNGFLLRTAGHRKSM